MGASVSHRRLLDRADRGTRGRAAVRDLAECEHRARAGGRGSGGRRQSHPGGCWRRARKPSRAACVARRARSPRARFRASVRLGGIVGGNPRDVRRRARSSRAPMSTGSLTVVLPVRNEAENLPAALASVEWADQIVVVDSGSQDATQEVARAAGAEVERVIATGTNAGYCVDRELVFMGRSLRCFRPNWNLRLFRAGEGRMEDLGLAELPGTGDNEIHEHAVVDGPIGFLQSPLLHDDYRGLDAWLDRHHRYATWEAHLYRKLRDEPIGVTPRAFLRLDPFRRKRVLR